MTRVALILVAVLLGVPWLASHLVAPYLVSLATLILVAPLARWPAVNAPAAALLNRCRQPSPTGLRWITLLIGVCSAAYLLTTALWQHRDLFPRIHDEHVYILQARMLALGRLWEPQHSLADFFDNFYLLSHPVYAPMVFPGTALFDVPFIKAGLPHWVMPLLLSSAAVAMTYYIVTVLVDGVAGLIAAMALIATWGLREFSTMVMAPAPMTLLGLLILCTWLSWQKHKSYWPTLFMGICIGWAAIMRPVDAIAFALPVGIAMLFDFRKLPVRRVVITLALIFVGMIPFVALQLIFDRGTTGHWLSTPYTTYLQQDQPGSLFGFHTTDPNARPTSLLPQKTEYYERYRLNEVKEHTLARLPYEMVRRTAWTLYSTIPAGILGILLPFSFLGLIDRRRWVFWSVLPLFILLYLANPFFLVHYPVPFATITAFSIALGADVLSRGLRKTEPNPTTSAFLWLIVTAVCISSLPEFRSDIRDGTVPAMPVLALTQRELASSVDGPSVVLFRYIKSDNPVEEPAYNDDVAWPDDAPIIRAHDLGTRNIEIARYYAACQPWRKFYLLDRRENTGRQHLILHYLGDSKQYLHALGNPL